MSSTQLKSTDRPTDNRKFSIIHDEDALNCLLLSTSRSEMFQRIWNKKDRLSFMSMFHQERYKRGDIVVEYGAALEKFYVVEEGAFEILTPKAEALEKHGKHGYDLFEDESAWRLESMLFENEHFGEPGLENAVLTKGDKVVRSPFRMRCSFPSRVLIVAGDAFARRWDALQESLSKEVKEGISKVKILCEWMERNPGLEMEILKKCRVMDLGPEDCVIRERAVGRNTYVITKGFAKSYVDDGTHDPLARAVGTYSPGEESLFGVEALSGKAYVETVVIKSRTAKLIVIPGRI